MKTKKKALLLVMCALLLVGATVMGTLAYLTDTTDNTATNTFTVGKVAISLTEAPVDGDGQETTGARTTGNTYSNVVPGVEYDKDPTIFVDKDSEDCWIFVKVENGISAFEKADATIESQITKEGSGWTALQGQTGVYWRKYEKPTHAPTEDTEYVVFEHFTLADNAPEIDGWDNFEDNEIVITGYAIQTADDLADAAAAWAALNP